MKMLEDAFSYANQLGARQGAGAVWLHVHHPDILRFLDTGVKMPMRKSASKTLSLGVVIPDITFQLAKEDAQMAPFSPYDARTAVRQTFRRLRHRRPLSARWWPTSGSASAGSAPATCSSALAEIQFESATRTHV